MSGTNGRRLFGQLDTLAQSNALLFSCCLSRCYGWTRKLLEEKFSRISEALGHSVRIGDRSTRFRRSLKEVEGSVFSIRGQVVSFSNPGIQDFLQRAVIEDGLLGNVLPYLEGLDEFEQAWAVFLASIEKGARVELTEAWRAAAERMLIAEEGHILRKTALLLNIFDQFGTGPFSELVDSAIKGVASSEFESDDVERIGNLLEQLASSSLPLSRHMSAVGVVTSQAEALLRDHGWCLRIDEIKTIREKLLTYGSSRAASENAVVFALSEYLEHGFSEELREMGGTDELDALEHELTRLLQNVGKTQSYSV